MAMALCALATSLTSPAANGPAAAACPDTPHRLETFSLLVPALGRSKRLLVYLPPGYDCTDRRYPVFYVNDGHDLFDWNPFAADLDPAIAADIAARDAWYGSWRLETQLDRAIASGRFPPLIVVGIAADDGLRSTDLAPVPWSGSQEAQGGAYGDFIARIVVPMADRRLRTLADRRCRGIAGASLGGISALQIGLAHPDRFGLVLALSPILGDPALAGYLQDVWAGTTRPDPATFLVDVDDDPIGIADQRRLAALIDRTPSPGRRTILVRTPQGRHSIASWAARVMPALDRLLLDTPCAGSSIGPGGNAAPAPHRGDEEIDARPAD